MAKATEHAIKSAFMELLQKKFLDDITVKELIEKAYINRNTFYYHYENIYDLLYKIFKEEAEKFQSEMSENSTFYDEYRRAASIFLENRLAVIHICHSKNRDVLNSYMERAAESLVGTFVRKASAGTGISEEGISYIIHFYSYAIVGNTMHWIENGMPEYLSDLLLKISQSFEATVDVMIKDYLEHYK